MTELSEIFERDPLSLTKDSPEIEAAIRAFRDMRYKFNLGDTRAGSVKPKAPAKTKEVKGLDISDLELKI